MDNFRFCCLGGGSKLDDFQPSSRTLQCANDVQYSKAPLQTNPCRIVGGHSCLLYGLVAVLTFNTWRKFGINSFNLNMTSPLLNEWKMFTVYWRSVWIFHAFSKGREGMQFSGEGIFDQQWYDVFQSAAAGSMKERLNMASHFKPLEIQIKSRFYHDWKTWAGYCCRRLLFAVLHSKMSFCEFSGFFSRSTADMKCDPFFEHLGVMKSWWWYCECYLQDSWDHWLEKDDWCLLPNANELSPLHWREHYLEED